MADRDGLAVLRIPGTTNLLSLHAANPQRYPHLLESASQVSRHRYDILFAFPGKRIESRSLSDDFLGRLDTAFRQERRPQRANGEALPPFRGGWFVFLAYELGGVIEPTAHISRPDADLPVAPDWPVALAERFPAAIINDHLRDETQLVAEEGADDLIALLEADLSGAGQIDTEPGRIDLAELREEDPGRFLDGVRRIREYIAAGDIFQVNLSRSWEAHLASPLPPWALHARLRRANPAPFSALALIDSGHALVSSSPERLVSVRHNLASVRPIAGTYPRGADAASDTRLASELLLHPKERAEHVMLVDLERNDLGRICRPGTIHVPEFLVRETYAHVHHLVSEVQGVLRDDAAPTDVVRAVFPGGTITGCPKVRCMQIIQELEACPRGAYTGSLGYLNRDGDLDLNILIRTIVLAGDRLGFRAGAGIVADSDPERELDETRAKARGLLRAVGAMTHSSP